ncbi:MAG: S-adenosyl-l-methionine hydroxide adenosyltransferase family protein [Kiloniellaceae bacterium]
MIVLFTDFGPSGPYVGQMKAVLHREAPGVPVVDLFCDAPAFDPQAAAYLLAAYAPEFPAGTVFLAVVDPGVGGPRAPLVVAADGRWYVGPDNGLFAIVARRAAQARAWEITWRPARLSASFHGRDVFAPVAARLARGEAPPGRERSEAETQRAPGADWPQDLARVVYIDHFGNAMTGLRAAGLASGAILEVAGRRLARARSFCDLPPGAPFWYENANGLAEIAVNRGHAARALGLAVGAEVRVHAR